LSLPGSEPAATEPGRPVSARRTLRDSFTFAGRATRTEFASFVLAAVLLAVGVSFITGLTLPYATHNLIGNVLAVLLAIPVPALLVRRFHDQDRTGRWVLLAGFAFAFWAVRAAVSQVLGYDARITLDAWVWPLDWLITIANIVTILLIVLPGTNGPNRYGADPRACEG
jgi:uncharacterized membrane protein YhaH (DUF805 family)